MASARQPFSRVLAQSQTSVYVCKSCRSQLSQPRITTTQQLRYASNKDLPFTEKIRRKIWGTDNPPGLADPYGGPSFLEKAAMRRKAARLAKQEQQMEEYPPEDTQRRPSPQQEPELERARQAMREEKQTMSEDLSYEPTRVSSTPLPPMETYEPAETTEGLGEVGHSGKWGDWKALPPKPQDDYVSWSASTIRPAENYSDLISCLHQAVVECLACKQANLNPSQALLLNPAEVDSNVYASTRVGVSSSGTLGQLQFESQEEGIQLLGQLATVGSTMDEAIVKSNGVEAQASSQIQEVSIDSFQAILDEPQPDLMGASEIMAPSNPTALEVSHYTVADDTFLASRLDLQDPTTFMILKRFTQLSGHRIPDPVLNSTVSGNQPKTLSYLLDRIYDTVVKPQPKNIAEILMSKQTLNGLGNVMVLPRRETPIDKEKEAGRWKVIERELKDRGLPVLGKLYN